jgi:hypothetical protein
LTWLVKFGRKPRKGKFFIYRNPPGQKLQRPVACQLLSTEACAIPLEIRIIKTSTPDMSPPLIHLKRTGWCVALLFASTLLLCAQSPYYGISSPGFFYNVTNIPANTVYPDQNPQLNLTAGATYRLIIGVASFHPVVIATNNTASPPVNAAYSGASAQIITSGAIDVTLPASNYPPVLYYRCNIHGFNGQINILPPPPANRIVSLSVTTNIILVSTGTTNTWIFVPEFRSNLVSGTWSTVPNYTNIFANNTNTTRFNRLDPICGPNVFLRIRQSPPN